MSRRNLIIASCVGGLITAGGVAAIFVLGQVWAAIFGTGIGLAIFVFILASVIGGLFGIGFALGLFQGKIGNGIFAAFVLFLIVLTVHPENYGDTAGPLTGPAWAAALIGPCLFGWSLSRLRAAIPMKPRNGV